MNTCVNHDHLFNEIGAPHDNNGATVQTVYCRKCGKTIEITIMDAKKKKKLHAQS